MIISVITGHSGKVFFVGGCVRDTLLGSPFKDIDVITDVDVSILIPTLEKEGWKVDTMNRHLFVLRVSKNNEEYDIVSFRKEKSKNRVITECELGTMLDDAKRRDFTVNAIYYDPLNDELHDPLTHIS